MIAEKLNIAEDVVLERINYFLNEGILTRVGPFFNMDKSSGYVSLVAMKVPEERFLEVTEIVNSYEQVAHNYKRTHELNMWFVIASPKKESAQNVLREIELKTGIQTYNFPKLKEYALDLFFEIL
jgi:DNA-binding Lrp family transcriptional regulator